MESIDPPYGEAEPRHHWFNDTEKLRVLAGFLAVIAGVLSIFGRTQATWVLSAGVGILLLSLVMPVITQRIKEFAATRRDRYFVAKEHIRLERYVEKFNHLCISRNFTNSFCYILYAASAYQPQIVLQIVGADYMPSWVACFEAQIKSPCRSLKSFLARCREFVVIVRNFNTDYVIRAQKGLDAASRVPKETFEQFEAFREDFAHLLRELEEWVDGLRKEATRRLTLSEQMEHSPFTSFDKAKPFVWKSLDAKNATQ